jgi:hypothetical protein
MIDGARRENNMTERIVEESPILYSGPMVRAIMEGRKTQTRRVAKLNSSGRVFRGIWNWHIEDPDAILACPYGVAGDRLWVRETMYAPPKPLKDCLGYAADGDFPHGQTYRIVPSIFMPRWACRLRLEIVSVRLDRLQDISEGDAQAEGWFFKNHPMDQVYDPVVMDTARLWYKDLWDSINGKKHPWSSNPLVWVVEFKKVVG